MLIPFGMINVSNHFSFNTNKIILYSKSQLNNRLAPKKDWSFNEWITNFLDADGAWGGYGDDGANDDPDYHDSYESGEWDAAHPDNFADIDDLYDDLDSGIIDSLIIIGLAGALAFLVYYRQQRQQRERRERDARGSQTGDGRSNGGSGAEEQEQRRGREGNDGGGGGGIGNGGERGLFPRPGDLDFNDWVAGGVGH